MGGRTFFSWVAGQQETHSETQPPSQFLSHLLILGVGCMCAMVNMQEVRGQFKAVNSLYHASLRIQVRSSSSKYLSLPTEPISPDLFDFLRQGPPRLDLDSLGFLCWSWTPDPTSSADIRGVCYDIWPGLIICSLLHWELLWSRWMESFLKDFSTSIKNQ